MGTNYSWKAAPADPLSVFGRVHIGKHSGGWSFTLHGYRFAGSPEQTHMVEVAPEGLYNAVVIPALPAMQVVSWQDWKALLLRPDSVIESEYGEVLDVAVFIEDVESHWHPEKGAWGDAKRKLLNHYDELRKRSDQFGQIDADRNWKDSEGFSVSGYEFS